MRGAVNTVKRILIVEDSAMTRSMIKAVIDDLGDIETVEASTGFEALKALPADSFDMIITDINMPDINGLELINFVKKDEQYRELPLLIISTEKSDEDKRRGLNIGANDYLTKPFKPEDLHEKLRKLLSL
jgi:two-component system chemotaxis response regulator CheY